MLDGLDRRATLLAITSSVTRHVAQKQFEVVFLHTWLAAILGSVPLAIGIDALDISTVTWRRARGVARVPCGREAAGSIWTPSGSSSSRPTSHKLLRDKGVDLGRLRVGRQAKVQDLSDAGLGVQLIVLISKLLLVLLTHDAAVGIHEVDAASALPLLVLQNLH